jgi:hypothetical protein
MAWVEQIGLRSWRVRCRTNSGYGSVSSFDGHETALEYLQCVPASQRLVSCVPFPCGVGPE